MPTTRNIGFNVKFTFQLYPQIIMKRYKYIAALLIGSLISFSGCTDNFRSDNEIKGAFNDEVKSMIIKIHNASRNHSISIYFQYNWATESIGLADHSNALLARYILSYFHDQVSKFNDKILYINQYG